MTPSSTTACIQRRILPRLSTTSTFCISVPIQHHIWQHQSMTPQSSLLCACQRLYCSALLMIIIFLYSRAPFEFRTISLHKVCPLLIYMICRVDTEQSNEIIYISCLTRCPQSRQSLSVDSAAVQDQARCRLDPCIPRKYTLHTGREYTAYRAHF